MGGNLYVVGTPIGNLQEHQMQASQILKRDREEIVLLCKRMKPEARLVAFLQHSQLVHRMYQAGLDYRSRLSPSRKKRRIVER